MGRSTAVAASPELPLPRSDDATGNTTKPCNTWHNTHVSNAAASHTSHARIYRELVQGLQGSIITWLPAVNLSSHHDKSCKYASLAPSRVLTSWLFAYKGYTYVPRISNGRRPSYLHKFAQHERRYPAAPTRSQPTAPNLQSRTMSGTNIRHEREQRLPTQHFPKSTEGRQR